MHLTLIRVCVSWSARATRRLAAIVDFAVVTIAELCKLLTVAVPVMNDPYEENNLS